MLETFQKQMDKVVSCYTFTVILLQIYGYRATDLRFPATDLRRRPQPLGKVLQIYGRGTTPPFCYRFTVRPAVAHVATDLQSET
jgi:hypothetical protein